MTTPLLSRRSFVVQSLVGATSLVSQPSPGHSQTAADSAEFRQLFTAATRQAIADGLTYLAARQNDDDNSYGNSPFARNVAACSLIGMAFISAGSAPGRGKFGRTVDRTIDFVLNQAQPSGFIDSGEPANRPMYSHGFGTLLLAEVYGNARHPALRQRLSAAVKLIIDVQNDEGGWRYEPRRGDADLSVTACQVMALRAAHNAGLHVPKATIDRAVAYIKGNQNTDGGFRYQRSVGVSSFERSAAAIVSLYNCGLEDDPAIAAGLAYLKKFPPRKRIGGQEYFFYGHYYAIQAMWHARSDWTTWYPAIRDVLLSTQRVDGSWEDGISSDYGTAMACLILQMPQTFLPIFER